MTQTNISTVIYDIETLFNYFLYKDADYKTGEKKTFRIGIGHNDLVEFVQYLKYGRLNQVGFNNLKFDGQVIQYILENADYWIAHNFTGEEIAKEIHDYANETIQKTNAGGWPDYPEWKIMIPQLDLMLIWHFDNKAKMTGLKWIQFGMDWPDLREMPIDHRQPITLEQIPEVDSYCDNDIMSTLQFFNFTMGRCEHLLYKGIDKLQLRKNIKEKFKIPCLNYNDVKIGDELNKRSYMRLTGIDKYTLKGLRAPDDAFTYGDCIPSYVEFKTEEMIEFYNKIKDIVVNSSSKEHLLKYKGTQYLIAKGGIHSKDKPRLVIPTENQILQDADIGLKIELWPN